MHSVHATRWRRRGVQAGDCACLANSRTPPRPAPAPAASKPGRNLTTNHPQDAPVANKENANDTREQVRPPLALSPAPPAPPAPPALPLLTALPLTPRAQSASKRKRFAANRSPRPGRRAVAFLNTNTSSAKSVTPQLKPAQRVWKATPRPAPRGGSAMAAKLAGASHAVLRTVAANKDRADPNLAPDNLDEWLEEARDEIPSFSTTASASPGPRWEMMGSQGGGKMGVKLSPVQAMHQNTFQNLVLEPLLDELHMEPAPLNSAEAAVETAEVDTSTSGLDASMTEGSEPAVETRAMDTSVTGLPASPAPALQQVTISIDPAREAELMQQLEALRQHNLELSQQQQEQAAAAAAEAEAREQAAQASAGRIAELEGSVEAAQAAAGKFREELQFAEASGSDATSLQASLLEETRQLEADKAALEAETKALSSRAEEFAAKAKESEAETQKWKELREEANGAMEQARAKERSEREAKEAKESEAAELDQMLEAAHADAAQAAARAQESIAALQQEKQAALAAAREQASAMEASTNGVLTKISQAFESRAEEVSGIGQFVGATTGNDWQATVGATAGTAILASAISGLPESVAAGVSALAKHDSALAAEIGAAANAAVALKSKTQADVENIASLHTTNDGLKVTIQDEQAQKQSALVAKSDAEAARKSAEAAQEAAEKEQARLKAQLEREEELRCGLHNVIQQLKGNIRVCVRFRPLIGDEQQHAELSQKSFVFPEKASVEVGQMSRSAVGADKLKKQFFTYDAIFAPSASQTDCYQEVSEFVTSALDGKQVCIFCYGITGSGKTYTMGCSDGQIDGEGNLIEDAGMMPRAIKQIFETLKGSKSQKDCSVTATCMEIYNEQITDLFDDAEVQTRQKERSDSLNKGTISRTLSRGVFDAPKGKAKVQKQVEKHRVMPSGVVSDLTSHTFRANELSKLASVFEHAMSQRQVGSTNCNEQSSRSHTIFQLRIDRVDKYGKLVNGVLNLIDLAGCERLAKSGAEGSRKKETTAINSSLKSLGDVICSLANKEKHVPYRNSQLTRCLATSIGVDDAKTCMFVNCSSVPDTVAETVSTLNFANKVWSSGPRGGDKK